MTQKIEDTPTKELITDLKAFHNEGQVCNHAIQNGRTHYKNGTPISEIQEGNRFMAQAILEELNGRGHFFELVEVKEKAFLLTLQMDRLNIGVK